MNNTIKFGSLIAGFLAAATFGAVAEEGKDGKRRPGGPRGGDRSPPAEILEKYDKDNSGDLNEDERAALRADMEKRREEMLAKYDSDNDGKLSPEERKAMILDRFDKDGNGQLSDEEKAAAKKAMQRRRPGGPGGRPGPGKRRGPDGKPGPRGDRKPGA
ncbi:MAG: EF-hand domain-containing protein [Akkermansiaceae bacterium]|nr:EF-hand domain-containing protein [Akkermansiaceae bacterium]